MKEKSMKKAHKSKTNLAKLRAKKDKDINYDDIPETSKEFWQGATLHVPSKKKAVSLRLDEDILQFFRKDGPGYQARMKSVLKSYVKAHTPKHKVREKH